VQADPALTIPEPSDRVGGLTGVKGPHNGSKRLYIGVKGPHGSERPHTGKGAHKGERAHRGKGAHTCEL